MANTNFEFRRILGQRVDATTYITATKQVLDWGQAGRRAYVCASNVHMVMEGCDDAELRQAVNDADLITADGMPLVWALRLLGLKEAERVYAPALMEHILEVCAREQVPVGLYGSSEYVIQQLTTRLPQRFKELQIAYACSPPYRALSDDEEQTVRDDIAKSGAKVLFVGLGCPKQEKWMARNKAAGLAIPTLGVGAAFDFLSGNKPQAPAIMQQLGLEWLFRMVTEPRRLWYRYFYHNPRFIRKFTGQLLSSRHGLKRL